MHQEFVSPGFKFASKTCFKRLSTVVSSSIAALSPSSISGTNIRSSLHTFSRRCLNCWADFASLIHCSSRFSLPNLMIKSLSTPSKASSLLICGSISFSSGGGDGSSMIITSFSTRGFWAGGCSITWTSSSRVLLTPLTWGLIKDPRKHFVRNESYNNSITVCQERGHKLILRGYKFQIYSAYTWSLEFFPRKSRELEEKKESKKANGLHNPL